MLRTLRRRLITSNVIFPNVAKYRACIMNLQRKIASSSIFPEQAFRWVQYVDETKFMEQLENSGDFATLDFKIASSLTESISGEFLRKVNVIEDKVASTGKCLKEGR